MKYIIGIIIAIFSLFVATPAAPGINHNDHKEISKCLTE
jgi:hypothetical protein